MVLGLLTIILIAIPHGLWSKVEKESCQDYESDDEASEPFPFLYIKKIGKLLLCKKGEKQLEGELGKNRRFLREDRVDVYDYLPESQLNITRLNENCLKMEWMGQSAVEEPLRDCFVMGDGAQWFGGHELFKQYWPLENINITMTPFLPHNYLDTSLFQTQDVFGPVLHPLWLTSNGAGILVERGIPLRVSINASNDWHLCIEAVPYSLECIPHSYEKTHLNYTLCVYNTIAETAQYFLREIIPHPTGVPDKNTFLYPLWATWPHLGTDVTSNTVSNYIADIREHRFNISQFEIGDGYGRQHWAYGDLKFDFDTSALDSNGATTILTAWVHPFVNPTSKRFDDKLDEDFYLPGKSTIEGDSISLVKWLHGYGAVINYLNDTVRDIQREELKDFMVTNKLSSLKFDTGEVTFLPKCVYIQNGENPGNFATAYATFAGNFSSEVSSRVVVRVGYYSQDQPIWVRLLDRSSTPGQDNGLHSVLTGTFTFGIAGYPFVMPDVIGGNGVSPTKGLTERPSKELFVRWMQLSAFLPAMPFSLPPFEYDASVTDTALSLVDLHRSLVEELIYPLAVNATNTGYPIIRPLWWIDSDLVSVNDQFLIGERVLVAPVLSVGVYERCVRFPAYTRWTRGGSSDDKVYPDACVSNDSCSCHFTVSLSEVLYFRRKVD